MSTDSDLTLYLYASLDSLLKIIETGKLKVSLPWGTNDITEGVPRNEQVRNYQTEAYGYICLSDNCTSPAMWGYYADRGRGACLVFRFKWLQPCKQNQNKEIIAWKIAHPSSEKVSLLSGKLYQVEYGEERSVFKSAEDILRYKSSDWKHEREYRYITPLADTKLENIIDTSYGKTGLYFVTDFTKYIAGIILGPRCQLQPIDVIEYVKKYTPKNKAPHISPDVDVVKAKFSPDLYSFIRQDDSPLSITGKSLIPSSPKPPFTWKNPED